MFRSTPVQVESAVKMAPGRGGAAAAGATSATAISMEKAGTRRRQFIKVSFVIPRAARPRGAAEPFGSRGLGRIARPARAVNGRLAGARLGVSWGSKGGRPLYAQRSPT